MDDQTTPPIIVIGSLPESFISLFGIREYPLSGDSDDISAILACVKLSVIEFTVKQEAVGLEQEALSLEQEALSLKQLESKLEHALKEVRKYEKDKGRLADYKHEKIERGLEKHPPVGFFVNYSVEPQFVANERTWRMFSSESAGDKCLILIPPTACHSELKEAIKNKLLDVDAPDDEAQLPAEITVQVCEESRTIDQFQCKSRDQVLVEVHNRYPERTVVEENAEWVGESSAIVRLTPSTEIDGSPPVPVPFDEPQTADRLGRNEVVRQLYTMVTNNLGQGFADFNQLSFCIYVPQFTSLKEQTEERVLAVPSLAKLVKEPVRRQQHDFPYLFDKDTLKVSLPEKNPKTLHVIIHDECHWGATKKKGSAALSSAEKFPLGGYCDRVLNDDAILGAPNVIVLCVSATPQNNLSCNSRIPSKNIVYWNKPELAYRSSASYIETAVESVNGNWTVAQKDTSLVRFDKVFKDRLESFAKIFGTNQPKNGLVELKKAICKDSKSESVYVTNAHFVAATYLLSLVYFAVFRVKDKIEIRDDGVVLRDDFQPVNDDSAKEFLEKISGFAKKLQEKTNIEEGMLAKVVVETAKLVLGSEVWEMWEKDRKVSPELIRSLEEKNRGTLTETDRAVKSLLTLHEPTISTPRVGNMVMVRFEMADQCKTIQDLMREGRDFLGMCYKDKRPFFMAISEAGNDDLLQGVKKENFMKCEMGRLNDKSTIESKLKSIKKGGSKMLTFGDVANLPCFVFLCEKGRMGDTFPASLQVVDLRLRSGGTYSCFMQEFGRVCRYVKRDEDKFRFHNNEWVWENHFKEGQVVQATVPVSVEELDWKNFCYFLKPIAGAMVNLTEDWNGTFANADILVRAPKSSVFKADQVASILAQLDAGWPFFVMLGGDVTALVTSKKELTDVQPCLTQLHHFVRVSHRLPTVLLKQDLYKCLEQACELKNALGKDCDWMDVFFPGTLIDDKLMHSTQAKGWACQNGKKSSSLHTALLNKSKTEKYNWFLGPIALRETWEASKDSFDHGNVGKTHSNRFLLSAQCQVGKTGAYLEFLELLHSALTGYPEPVLEPESDSDEEEEDFEDGFRLPSWTLWFTSNRLSHTYNKPKEVSKYHHIMAQRRASRLHDKVSVDAVVDTMQRLDVVDSAVGVAKLEELRTALCKLPLNESIALEKVLNYDGRFSKYLKTPEEKQKLPTLHESKQVSKPKGVRVFKTTRIKYKESAHPRFENVSGGSEETIDMELPPGTSTRKSVPLKLWTPPNAPKLSSDGKLPVFIPSYNRAEVARLDFSTTLEPDRVVFVLVRNGEEYDKYVKRHGGAIRIVTMPSSFPFKYSNINSEIEVNEKDGHGFACLICQLLAHHLKYKAAWILDDNVGACFQRRVGEKTKERIYFRQVMMDLEKLFVAPKEVLLDPPVGAKLCNGDAAFGNNSERNAGNQESFTVNNVATPTVAHYCGSSENYGVVGIRCRGKFEDHSHKAYVTDTFSVYSFLIVNIEQTIKRGAFYPSRNAFDDIDFNHRVDEVGLQVIKFNNYLYKKVPILPPPEKWFDGVVSKIKEVKGNVKVLGSSWKEQSAWGIEQTENLIVAGFPLFKAAIPVEPVDGLIIINDGDQEQQARDTSYDTMMLGYLEQACKSPVKHVFMITSDGSFPKADLLKQFKLTSVGDNKKIHMSHYKIKVDEPPTATKATAMKTTAATKATKTTMTTPMSSARSDEGPPIKRFKE